MCSKFLHLYWQNLSYICEVEYTFYLCLAYLFSSLFVCKYI